MHRLTSIWTGKAVQRLTRLRGGGSALPGLIVERINPKFLAKTATRLTKGSILVTGTNGKTTTAKMLRNLLEKQGLTVIHNRAGSNMSRGIVSTLVEHSGVGGKLRGDIGVFEVDEAWIPIVAKQLKPRAIIVLNLLRDQLDRYGELDTTARLIGSGLPHSQTVVLNADDPLVAKLAEHVPGGDVRYFGVSQHLRQQLPDDASLLTKTKPPVRHRSDLSVLLQRTTSRNGSQTAVFEVGKQDFKINLPLDGVYNAANAAAVLATIQALGLDLAQAAADFATIEPAYGRTELIELGNKRLQLLLVKNPAGFNQIIKTFLLQAKEQPILMALNDGIADGRDVSWIYDVDFEQLHGQNHHVLTTGTRGLDLSVRLKYAEVESHSELRLGRALNEFVTSLKAGQTGYVVPTYTAMLALRRLLGKEVKLPEVWE